MPHLLRRLLETAIDLRRLRGLLSLPRFAGDYLALRRRGLPLHLRNLYPQLGDHLPRTPFDPHYFHQAAWLCRRLADQRPAKHVDIGSDVRLVAAFSAFVPTEFIDIRPLPVALSGLECAAGNLTDLARPDCSIASLSCLHVIEHIGLGRYGDPLDPDGPSRAIGELARVLAPQGRLYVSTPVGRPRVEFNAHHVFDAAEFASRFTPLRLERFDLVGDDGSIRRGATPEDARNSNYACGLFEFVRPATATESHSS